MDLEAFLAKWAQTGGAERANKDSFLRDLSDVLRVPRPDPTTNDPKRDAYVFERAVRLRHPDGHTTVGRIDLYKRGCFVLEAKQGSQAHQRSLGTARRGTPFWSAEMERAFIQARNYVDSLPEGEPLPVFIVTCDIGECFELYAQFDGSGIYRAYPDSTNRRIYLTQLRQQPELLERLRAVWTDPVSLDPRTRSEKVTTDIARSLARLAENLERDRKNAPDVVATFLMRCIFTMFAEDVGLLPSGLFTSALKEHWIPAPDTFPGQLEALWQAMNDGQSFGFVGKLLKFNGGLFSSPKALPLNEEQLWELYFAAKHDWSQVEPAIFGTLLERALSAKERSKLGAHFTPRAYVERLVRPAVEEPLRADWDVVRAQVRQLVDEANRALEVENLTPEQRIARGRAAEARAARSLAAQRAARTRALNEAIELVQAFRHQLVSTRVLDPACGSGNFLYVTLDVFKRLEAEVLQALADLGVPQEQLETERVTPRQFLGIEKKRWAKEIAELVLWIGYLQWHFRTHGKLRPPPEPVLQDYRNIEHGDALLAWTRIVPELDEDGTQKTRWDGESYKRSPVTGELVPQEEMRVPCFRYVNPHPATWPPADFIVGNPPFLGKNRIRITLGDDYVDALRAAHGGVPETADFVMYWWDVAAQKVEKGESRRFGLITTNSIVQVFNRQVVSRHLPPKGGVSLAFAIPDHPWVDSDSSAAVRIAMTVGTKAPAEGQLCRVTRESTLPSGESVVDLSCTPGTISADLRVGADVAAAGSLRSNAGLSFQGIIPLGDGFKLTAEEAKDLRARSPQSASCLRRYVIGRDLAQRAEERWLIDFFGLTAEEALRRYPDAYQRVLDRVKPERDQNRRDARRLNWWLFAENAPKMRRALAGLKRYIGTPETAKHRFFVFLGGDVLPDQKLRAIALEDAFFLGVLSSRIHVVWALATGATLEDRPVYNNTLCFDRFAFPAAAPAVRERIRELGEALDEHRRARQAAHPTLTLTNMYNVLAKLREGEELDAGERATHEAGLVSVLREIHDRLDAAVFEAYGWPQDLSDEGILERLVALNAERVREEQSGNVRWLRPDYQRSGEPRAPTRTPVVAPAEEAGATRGPALVWPKQLPDRIALVRDLVSVSRASWTVRQVTASFKGARANDVEPILESLAAIGILVGYSADGERRYRSAGRVDDVAGEPGTQGTGPRRPR